MKGEVIISGNLKPHWQQQEIEQILRKTETCKRGKGQRKNQHMVDNKDKFTKTGLGTSQARQS